MLRSDLFEVEAMPRRVGGAARLPRHVIPKDGEALFSWLAQLGVNLGLAPLAFGREAFGIRASSDPEWWRRPNAEILKLIERRTGVDIDRIKSMTLSGWAEARDDERHDRFAARRWEVGIAGRSRGRCLDICPVCVEEAERPCLQLIWMLGWAAVCPRHCVVLTRKCASCTVVLRTETRKAAMASGLDTCRRCGARGAGDALISAPPAVLSLQAALIDGKRTGTTTIAGLNTLDWQTTVALADVLLAVVWVDGSAERRRRLLARIAADLGLTLQNRDSVSWTSNYGGLLILTWLLGDLRGRLQAAIATLCTPHVVRLLDRVPDLDEEMRDRLLMTLAPPASRMPQRRRAWRRWFDNTPENAAELRTRANCERYKHRRQRLTAFAELKNGMSVKGAAAIVGVRPRSLYRWLQRGASDGMEAALERPTGRPALTAYQAEMLAEWIVADRQNQNRHEIVARAAALFGVALSLDAASKLLAKHGRPKPGQRRRRLWRPTKIGPPSAGPTHSSVPGP